MGDIAENQMDEDAIFQPVKKLKKRPTPNHLTPTAASKALRQPHPQLSNTEQISGQQRRGINTVPLSMSKPTQPSMAQTIAAANYPAAQV